MIDDARLKRLVEDRQLEEHVVKKVEPTDEGFVLSCVHGGCLLVPNPDALVPPVPGETVRFYGKGFGYPVRGVVCGARVYYYQTIEEMEEAHRAEAQKLQTKRELEWKEGLGRFNERLAALPEPFRQRIEFFMRNKSWGPNFGPYELFCCEQAVAIAGACKTRDEMLAFRDMPHDRQRALVPDLSDDHSGNTFGMACQLATVFTHHPHLLRKFHGALCPLVGCVEYGCYASTDEAKKEMETRGEEG